MYACPTNQIGSTINSNQIYCLKGKWYVRRFDPDIVQNGHIYSTMKEEKVLISSFSVGYAEDFSYGQALRFETVHELVACKWD